MQSSAPPEFAPMRPALLVSLLVVCTACTVRVIQPAPAAAPGGGGGGGWGGGGGGGGAKPDSAKKDLPWKPFAQGTKDARIQTGLVTVYLKRASAYLALQP